MTKTRTDPLGSGDYFGDVRILACCSEHRCRARISRSFPESYSLQLVRGGGVSLAIDHGPSLRIERPSMFWLHPDHHYAYQPLPEIGWWSHHYVIFVGDRARRWLEDFLMPRFPRGFQPLADPAWLGLTFDRLRESWGEGDLRQHPQWVAWIEQLVAGVAQPHDPATLSGVELGLDTLAAEMREDPQRRFDYAFESRAMNLSESQLRRRFRARFGRSPHAYLLDQRMHRAAERLRDSEATISEVARHFGFNDLSHFHRLFRGRFGLSPSAYIRSARR